MSWLFLSVFSFTIAMLLFKQFERSKVDNLPAITVNYFVAAACGFIFHATGPMNVDILGAPWLWYAVVVGVMFIVLFNLIALTAQRVGVSVATVANKMSVVIPIMVAIPMYDESLSWLKLSGIIVALIAVYLTTKPARNTKLKPGHLWLVVIIFLASGLLDAIFNDVAQRHLTESGDSNIFTVVTFCIAGIIGLVVTVVTKGKFSRKNVLGGIALGIPNYGSLLFLLFALDAVAESSQVYPINNMGIVAASALGAFIIFKEKLTGLNWLGIGLAILAISMIAFEAELLGRL